MHNQPTQAELDAAIERHVKQSQETVKNIPPHLRTIVSRFETMTQSVDQDLLDDIVAGCAVPEIAAIQAIAKELTDLRENYASLSSDYETVSAKLDDLTSQHDELRGYFSDGEKAFRAYSEMRTICDNLKENFERLGELEKDIDRFERTDMHTVPKWVPSFLKQ